ncbi:MAG: hypothetical protein ABSB50_03430 [Terracidiphilus sp.]|jgi:hypothetical protein
MGTIRACCCLALVAACATASAAFAQTQATQSGPVPPAIASAKTVFVSNAGSDSGLFPEPFTGDPGRPYAQFYSALKATGDFTLAGDPSQADLVLEIRLTAPYGPTNPNKQNGTSDPLPMFRLVVYDAKTHYILWTVTSSIEFAFLQKTHDRNFDEALNQVLNQFLRLAGKPPAPAH